MAKLRGGAYILLLIVLVDSIFIVGFGVDSAGIYVIPFVMTTIFLALSILIHRNNLSHPSIILGLLYCGNSAIAIYLDRSLLHGFYINEDIWVIIGYSLFLVIMLWPSLLIRRFGIRVIGGNRIANFIIKFSWPLILYSILYQLPFALASYSSGALDIRTNLASDGILPSSVFTTIAVGVSFFYPLFIIFYFQARIYKMRRFYQIGMLMGALLGIESGIVFAARDRLIWVPFFFYVGYWY